MDRDISASRRKPIAPNQRYGRLVSVELVDRDRWGAALWRFRCDCGNENYVARPDQVRRGKILSCGCFRNEQRGLKSTFSIKHGHSRKGRRSSEYRSWRNMIDRCYEPSTDSYQYYGARGIIVCDRWRHSFENFLADMGMKPAPKCTIGRLKNNLNYEPDNCRWESPKQQARNRSTSRLVYCHGRMITVAEACEISGIPRNVADARLNRGWSEAKVFSTPVKLHRPRS